MDMEKRSNSFVKGAAILAIAGLIVKIIGAFFRIPLANAVGPVAMSYYEIVYGYYAWLLVISSSGLPTAISKTVSERVTLGDYYGARAVFKDSLVLMTLIGVITAPIMFFGADALAGLSTLTKASLSFRALAPSLFFVSIMCAYRGYLQGMQQMTGTAVSQIAEQVGKLVVGLYLAIRLLPRGPEYAAMGALIGVTISEFLGLAVIWLFYMSKRNQFARALKRSDRRIYKRGAFMKALLLIAIPITIGASISPLTGIMDGILIVSTLKNLGFNVEAAQTAYSLLRTNVTTLVNMPGVLTMALAMSLVPAISAYVAKKDFKRAKVAARLGMKLALIIGLPCAVGLFVLSKPVLLLLYPSLTGSQLSLASELLKTASVGVIFLSLVQSMTGVIQGLGKPSIPVFNLFIGFVLKVVVMLILMNIPSINIQGAAVSTVVCYAFAGIADTVYTVRKTGMRLDIFDSLVKPAAASLVMGLAASVINNLLEAAGHERLGAIVGVLVGVLIYAALMLLLGMFSPEELDMIPGGNKIRALLKRFQKRPKKA
ncbi:MAG TPA: polysaccharide biosynthesis protein [Clostridia bacterium]|nr:polysaccharide biosynthesis protein [Clostridia bacterium]